MNTICDEKKRESDKVYSLENSLLSLLLFFISFLSFAFSLLFLYFSFFHPHFFPNFSLWYLTWRSNINDFPPLLITFQIKMTNCTCSFVNQRSFFEEFVKKMIEMKRVRREREKKRREGKNEDLHTYNPKVGWKMLNRWKQVMTSFFLLFLFVFSLWSPWFFLENS